MKNITKFKIVLGMLAMHLCLYASSGPSGSADPLALTHINILPMDQEGVLGPRLILSRMIDGAGKAWPPPISTWINGAAEAGKAVVDAHKEGYDRIKVYSFLDRAS